jgi:hypothetical protein
MMEKLGLPADKVAKIGVGRRILRKTHQGIQIFESISQASKETGVSISAIRKSLLKNNSEWQDVDNNS